MKNISVKAGGDKFEKKVINQKRKSHNPPTFLRLFTCSLILLLISTTILIATSGTIWQIKYYSDILYFFVINIEYAAMLSVVLYIINIDESQSSKKS